MKKFLSRFRLQRNRTTKLFAFEWEPDQLGGLTVASITIFGVSFVYLGTAL